MTARMVSCPECGTLTSRLHTCDQCDIRGCTELDCVFSSEEAVSCRSCAEDPNADSGGHLTIEDKDDD